jgi:hypothetical protein
MASLAMDSFELVFNALMGQAADVVDKALSIAATLANPICADTS